LIDQLIDQSINQSINQSKTILKHLPNIW